MRLFMYEIVNKSFGMLQNAFHSIHLKTYVQDPAQ